MTPFIIERILNAPVSLVWEALTDKEQMKKWYFDLAEFRPEVGFKFTFNGQGRDCEQYVHLCEITQVIPLKKLSYSWKYDKYPGNSEVTFELTPEGNKTRLKLTHTGLESFPQDRPDFRRESFAEGWTHIIGKSLPEFLEKVVI